MIRRYLLVMWLLAQVRLAATWPSFAVGKKITATLLNNIKTYIDDLIPTALTTWTPQVRYGPSGTPWDLGSGATVDCTYQVLGRRVFCSVYIVLGGSGLSTPGAGALTLTTPTNLRRVSQNMYFGTANIVDSSASIGYGSFAASDITAGRVSFFRTDNGQSIQAGLFVPATGDQIRADFSYELP